MSMCCQTPHIARIEKIKNTKKLSGEAGEKKVQTSQVNENLMPLPLLPRDEMTPIVFPIEEGMPAAPADEDISFDWLGEPASPNEQMPTIAPIEGGLFPDAPLFRVPSNPLLPGEYQELLDYGSLQYVNGFYRTQIGRYVRVDHQTSSNEIQTLYGYMVGVGINYVILQDPVTKNIMAIDSYSIKFLYVYYNLEDILSPIGERLR